MKIGEFRFLDDKWGIVKERKGYAIVFGNDNCFAYVVGYFTRYQAKKELERITFK
tara:strand:- start:539 stop:703 length:165 start_codon:yes stop_codon:yes gene_type:complete